MELKEYLNKKEKELKERGAINLKLRIRAASKEEGWLAYLEDSNQLRLSIKEAPEKGKANKAVINFLAAYFQTTKDKIRIKQGHTQPHKLLEIRQ